MNELKVGLLSLLAVASMVIVSLKITSNKSGFGNYIEYRTLVEDATGIYENSSIKVAGIVAGKIKSISLKDSQALITFEVNETIKISSKSALRIKTVGFLGDKYIDIHLGDESAPRLTEGSIIGNQTGAGFEELGKDASDVLKDVKSIAKAVKDSMYDDQDQNVIKAIVQNVKEFTKNANDISASLKRIISDNEGKLNGTIENLDRIAKQLAFETDRYSDGSLMNDFESIQPILDNVNQATRDIKDIVADIKSGKGTVGKLLRDEEVVDQVTETLSGVNRLVGRINNFKSNLSFYSGANSEYGARTDLNFDLIPAPERFFTFGLVISDYGPLAEEETTTTTTIDDDPEVVKNERVVNESQFKFNFLIGRKYGNVSFKAGLIETTGGLAIDYQFSDYGIVSSLEAFDYQSDAGANLRLSTEFRIWNILHAKIMGEDLASKSGDQTYTVSAGLKFSDEDLAALMGFLVN